MSQSSSISKVYGALESMEVRISCSCDVMMHQPAHLQGTPAHDNWSLLARAESFADADTACARTLNAC